MSQASPRQLTRTTLAHPEGTVIVSELGNGRRRLEVQLGDTVGYSQRARCETTYPVELIERVLASAGARGVCDEILRDEDPGYVQHYLRWAMLTYFDEAFFEGKRLLDFGCGRGASTVVLARMFPRTEIVGVELNPDSVRLAEVRARYYGQSNIQFICSPSGSELPAGIDDVDLVSMSAVYEHLLPDERRVLLPKLWSLLELGGVLFLNQTPYRWFPVEYHTTGLPLLNFVPDRWAGPLARRFSSARIDRQASWAEMLRGGIRGATEREILRVLRDAGAQPELLAPVRPNMRDAVDLWYAASTSRRPSHAKRALRPVFKALSRATGEGFVPSLELAIRKIN